MENNMIKSMTMDNLPPATTPEIRTQYNILRQLAGHSEFFRLVLFPLPSQHRQHVKHALRNLWWKKWDVEHTTVSDFIDTLLRILCGKDVVSVLSRYRDCDVLIMDDFQHIAGKDATQTYFLDAVLKPRLAAKKLTVLLSDRPVEELFVPLHEELWLILLGSIQCND